MSISGYVCFISWLTVPGKPQSLKRWQRLWANACINRTPGYSSCGLDCAECDELVTRLSALGAVNGVYGARITGGGSGGAVAVLAKRSAEEAILSVAADYADGSGAGGYVFAGSSDGASVHPLQPLSDHMNF